MVIFEEKPSFTCFYGEGSSNYVIWMRVGDEIGTVMVMVVVVVPVVVVMVMVVMVVVVGNGGGDG